MLPQLASKEVGACLKLGLTGLVVGPVVDGIHNQALLSYDLLPLELGGLHTSFLVPPLLALAYPVLGFVLPKVGALVFEQQRRRDDLGVRALSAVASTACIVKLSEVAVTTMSPLTGLILVASAALLQWALLDASILSLVVALAAALGGPLAELPFIANGAWHYLNPDYFPLGGNDLGLSLITGPCYFAVTTDAIALCNFFLLAGGEKTSGTATTSKRATSRSSSDNNNNAARR